MTSQKERAQQAGDGRVRVCRRAANAVFLNAMRCLVVPSDGYLTAQVARALTGRGCEVASAPSETEAAAALDSADVVVVDLLRAGALADGIVDIHKASAAPRGAALML